MSTTKSRGGFVEGVESIDLNAPLAAGGCCGGADSGGCCGEPAPAAQAGPETGGCRSEPTAKETSSGCCGGADPGGCC